MKVALLINNQDVKRYSPLVGSLDDDKLSGYVEQAQNIHLENYLGTKLYDAIQVHILKGTLPAEYELLIDKYIKPMLIRWVLVEFLPFAPYNVSNKGIFKGKSENSEPIDKDELDDMILNSTNTAKHYTKRLIEFLCNNSSDYPEYNTNVGSDMYPSRNNSYGGIYFN